jgi:hypothetical protein
LPEPSAVKCIQTVVTLKNHVGKRKFKEKTAQIRYKESDLVLNRLISFVCFKIFIAQRVYKECTRINYKIVPVTELNKYLHYGTSNLVADIEGGTYRLRVFENRMLRKIFGPKGDEATGVWRKLHNEELHDLYSSPNIMLVFK